jgi:hypothetical protein
MPVYTSRGIEKEGWAQLALKTLTSGASVRQVSGHALRAFLDHRRAHWRRRLRSTYCMIPPLR